MLSLCSVFRVDPVTTNNTERYPIVKKLYVVACTLVLQHAWSDKTRETTQYCEDIQKLNILNNNE